MNYLEIVEEQLRRDEGIKKFAYQDSRGYWTIGAGRLIDERIGGGLSDEEIEYLLSNDIDRAVTGARRLVTTFDSLSETRKAVLVNMAFNLGYIRFSGFKKMLEAVDEGRFEDAAKEMLNSTWAQQVSSRAVRLAQQMKEGDKP